MSAQVDSRPALFLIPIDFRPRYIFVRLVEITVLIANFELRTPGTNAKLMARRINVTINSRSMRYRCRGRVTTWSSDRDIR